MFYLLAVVTFLATILFYSFYPRTDGIKTMDKPWARTAVSDMVVRHTSAQEAARVVSFDTTTGKNKAAYANWTVGTLTTNFYADFLPTGFQVYTTNVPTTRLLCIDNETGAASATCGVYSANTNIAFPKGTTDFLMTYTPLENVQAQVGTYLANVAKRSLGETVFLTKYTPEEHLRVNCGVVDCSAGIATGNDFDPAGTCMLNNTRYLTVRLPRQITAADDGLLMCITRLGAAYDENKNIIYPQSQ